MNKNLTTMIGALLALALLAAACGGGDDASSADQAVIDAVAEQLRENEDGAPDGVDVDCMAAAMVSGMGGAEAMESNYGLSAASIRAGQDTDDVELPKDEAIALASGAMECGLGNFILEEMTGEGNMAEDDAKCLFDNLDQDAVRDMMAAEFMGSADANVVGEAAEDALFSSMFGAISACDIDPTSLGL